jgi:hypothetical protein
MEMKRVTAMTGLRASARSFKMQGYNVQVKGQDILLSCLTYTLKTSGKFSWLQVKVDV